MKFYTAIFGEDMPRHCGFNLDQPSVITPINEDLCVFLCVSRYIYIHMGVSEKNILKNRKHHAFYI
jgi:hypothetical protein